MKDLSQGSLTLDLSVTIISVIQYNYIGNFTAHRLLFTIYKWDFAGSAGVARKVPFVTSGLRIRLHAISSCENSKNNLMF